MTYGGAHGHIDARGATMAAAAKKAKARAALESIVPRGDTFVKAIDAFGAACVEEALQPMRKYLLLVYRQTRGGGAGGQMITAYKCLACMADEVAGSTAHGGLCRTCDGELRDILRATKEEG